MQVAPLLLIVGAAAVVLVSLLLWAWKRNADDRADHERQIADLRVEHQQNIRRAREQSVRQSRSGLLGNAAEQIAPMVPSFCERFSPSDARFLGGPIDYIIFDGMHRGEVERVIFLEVKSGASSALNKNEREVRRAIDERRVEFEVLSLASPLRAATVRHDTPDNSVSLPKGSASRLTP